MPYSNFTLEEVKEKFTLKLQSAAFFPELAPIAPSDWLEQTLVMALPLAQTTGSEKARSEFILAPILLELRSIMNNSISVFSGEDFTVDRDQGLSGICDFLISQTTTQFMIDAPVLALVEAKKGVLKDGWGQIATQGSEETSEQSVANCIAEMVAAKKFNDNRGKSIKYIYGIVTSGSLWHFFQMQGDIVLIDPNEYSLLPIDKLLAALKWMVSNDNN
jgi:hypothetical protein